MAAAPTHAMAPHSYNRQTIIEDREPAFSFIDSLPKRDKSMDMERFLEYLESALLPFAQQQGPLSFKDMQWGIICTYMEDKRLSDLVAHTHHARDVQELIEWIQKRRDAETRAQQQQQQQQQQHQQPHHQPDTPPQKHHRVRSGGIAGANTGSRRPQSPTQAQSTGGYTTMMALENILERVQHEQYKWHVSLCHDFNAIVRKLKYDIADHGEYMRKEWGRQSQAQAAELEVIRKTIEAELEGFRGSKADSMHELYDMLEELRKSIKSRDAEMSVMRSYMAQLAQQNMIYFCTIGVLLMYLVFVRCA